MLLVRCEHGWRRSVGANWRSLMAYALTALSRSFYGGQTGRLPSVSLPSAGLVWCRTPSALQLEPPSCYLWALLGYVSRMPCFLRFLWGLAGSQHDAGVPASMGGVYGCVFCGALLRLMTSIFQSNGPWCSGSSTYALYADAQKCRTSNKTASFRSFEGSHRADKKGV